MIIGRHTLAKQIKAEIEEVSGSPGSKGNLLGMAVGPLNFVATRKNIKKIWWAHEAKTGRAK